MDLFKKKKTKSMDIKMAINLQLSTIESKKTNKANHQKINRIINMEIIWRVISGAGEGGEWGKRYRD